MTSPAPHPGQGVYSISVAADLVGIGVQTLRLYERRGLIEPQRTEGGTRRYSQEDVDRIRRITELLAEGLNLAGIAVVLDLQDDNARMRAELDEHPTQLRSRSRTRQPRPPTK
jgi:MerR family transcriptional regulator, heat shock protein HspR